MTQSYTCRRAEGGDGPAGLRVRVVPSEKAILVDPEGAGPDGEDGPTRYILDQAFIAWFGGRHERDPKRGVVMSPVQGGLWLDAAPGGPDAPGSRGPHRFQCQPDAATAQAP